MFRLVLLELELLELLNSALETPGLRLEVDQFLLVLLLDGLGDLLLVDGVVEHLVLLVNVGASLVELLLRLLDFGVEVDAALDMQVDGSRGGHREGDTAGGTSGIGTDDIDAGDALAAKGLDGGDLLVDCLEGGSVVGLDDNWTFMSQNWYRQLTSALFLLGVLAHERSGTTGASQDKLVGGLGLGVVELGVVDGVAGNHDGLGLVFRAAGQALPQLLREEGSEGVDHGQRTLKGGVKGLDGAGSLLRCAVLNDGLAVLDVDIAQEVQDVLVHNASSMLEVTVGQGGVDLLRGRVELVEDPALSQSDTDSRLLGGNKVRRQLAEDILGRLPDLVAELSPASHDLDIEVDVTACRGKGGHGEAQTVSTVARETIREGRFLVLLGLGDLARVKIAHAKLGMEVLELDSSNGIQWIDDVAQTLAHLATLGVTDKTVAVDLSEGDLACKLDAEHHHSGDPEEQDIPASLENRSGVELLQILGLVGPTQGREGPQARGKPGVKNVLILLEGERLAGKGSLGLGLGLLASLAGEPLLVVQRIRLLALNLGQVDGAAVTPPELSRNTPIVDVGHPSVEATLGRLRANLDSAVLNSSNSIIGHAAHAHVPLRLKERLNDLRIWSFNSNSKRDTNILGAFAERDSHGIVLLVDVEAELLELLLDGVSDARNGLRNAIRNERSDSLESLLALVLATVLVDVTVIGENVDELELVLLAEVEIVGIVRRGQLDSTSTELLVDVGVGDNGQQTTLDNGVLGLLANEVRVSGILGMDSNTSVTEHRLNTGGGNLDGLVGTINGVFEVNQNTEFDLLLVAWNLQQRAAGQLLVDDLEVRQGSSEPGRPVDESVGAVNGALLEEFDEGLGHGGRQIRVHRKGLTAPVEASSHFAESSVDLVVVLALPGPDLVDEFLTAQVVTRLSFSSPEHIFNNALCRDAGMVATGDPQCRLAQHAVPSNHDILKGVAKGVAEMQRPSDVGRGMSDDELARRLDLAIGSELGLCALDGFGVVGLEVRVLKGLEALLLSYGGIFNVFGDGLFLLLLGLGLLLLVLGRGGCGGSLRGLFGHLLLELGVLLGLLALLLQLLLGLHLRGCAGGSTSILAGGMGGGRRGDLGLGFVRDGRRRSLLQALSGANWYRDTRSVQRRERSQSGLAKEAS
ncbi:LOW QUALITY PROTEIN: uncharacterized protein ColTof3_02400 [Colletotrichum tofieldiae]|nr:LOW QUALITY PROTEIN: uncharacterized protein ColTof3_02400 [Colletotrichum tofieldiae]